MEYKKHIFGEATKGIVAALVGAVLFWFSQQWLNSDLEYTVASRDAYLSAPLGQQGLAMNFNNKSLKNVSIVEYSIINRTNKQIANAELLFTVDDKSTPFLVSAGIQAPQGLSTPEVVENLIARDSNSRKFKLKVIPKQLNNEYYHAVFVFEGDKAPTMSVSSISGDISIIPYLKWKDTVIVYALLTAFFSLVFATFIIVTTLIDYFQKPFLHTKQVDSFVDLAKQLQNNGKLLSTDPAALIDAGVIFAEYARPKPSRFWSKFLKKQNYTYNRP